MASEANEQDFQVRTDAGVAIAGLGVAVDVFYAAHGIERWHAARETAFYCVAEELEAKRNLFGSMNRTSQGVCDLLFTC